MDKNLRPAAAYEPVQKHQVTPSIPGWLKNACENVWKMAAILSQPQGVNPIFAEVFWGNIQVHLPLHHSSTLRLHRQLKSFLMEDKDLFMKHGQHHGHWWLSVTRCHSWDLAFPEYTGPWFNIKMSSCQYRKSHCWDKTVIRSSYLHNGISYTGKMISFYWIGPLVSAPLIAPARCSPNFKEVIFKHILETDYFNIAIGHDGY